MGSCAAPSAKGDDKFITTDYLQQCPLISTDGQRIAWALLYYSVICVDLDLFRTKAVLLTMALYPGLLPD